MQQRLVAARQDVRYEVLGPSRTSLPSCQGIAHTLRDEAGCGTLRYSLAYAVEYTLLIYKETGIQGHCGIVNGHIHTSDRRECSDTHSVGSGLVKAEYTRALKLILFRRRRLFRMSRHTV